MWKELHPIIVSGGSDTAEIDHEFRNVGGLSVFMCTEEGHIFFVLKKDLEHRSSGRSGATVKSWHKITLSFKSSAVGGEAQRLQDAFAAILTAKNGKPWTAALYSQRSDDYENVFYYFSPDATQIAGTLIENYEAVPCDPPPRPSVQNHLSLAVGDARSVELLWPEDRMA